ncbi:MAG: 50S ribosomal protein L22 [Candidatus Ryanbacteria bacterium]|nr:50S ribosomal protein L22 [Candidatus Ryanbacteria bacterium]
MTQITAQLSRLRIAPRKVRSVANALKGMDVVLAAEQLRELPKASAMPLLKLVKSAEANARHNARVPSGTALFIRDIRVDEGPAFKRFMPRARGRATPIRKRTSHIKLVLETK